MSVDDKILPLVERLRDYKMSAEEFAEQRVGFAYGNAPRRTPPLASRCSSSVTGVATVQQAGFNGRALTIEHRFLTSPNH